MLAWSGLTVQRQTDVPIVYDLEFETAFRADLIVQNQVVVEIETLIKNGIHRVAN